MISALRADVILKPLEAEIPKSGLIIPERTKKELQGFKGEVVSVGPKHTLGCKTGDIVLYRMHEGKKVGDLLCMEERHLLAILK